MTGYVSRCTVRQIVKYFKKTTGVFLSSNFELFRVAFGILIVLAGDALPVRARRWSDAGDVFRAPVRRVPESFQWTASRHHQWDGDTKLFFQRRIRKHVRSWSDNVSTVKSLSTGHSPWTVTCLSRRVSDSSSVHFAAIWPLFYATACLIQLGCIEKISWSIKTIQEIRRI